MSLGFSCMTVVWSLFSMRFIANCSMHVHQTRFVQVLLWAEWWSKKMPCQLFVRPPSFDTGTTDNTSQLFEYIKQCFHVNGLILLPESTLCKGGLLVLPYPIPAHTPPSCTPNIHTRTHSLCHCSYIMASHVAGLAVMKCEACDATGNLPCGTVLSILVHHL